MNWDDTVVYPPSLWWYDPIRSFSKNGSLLGYDSLQSTYKEFLVQHKRNTKFQQILPSHSDTSICELSLWFIQNLIWLFGARSAANRSVIPIRHSHEQGSEAMWDFWD